MIICTEKLAGKLPV